MKTKIQELLIKNLSALRVEVIDDSDLHKGHKEAMQSGGGHFSVVIVANKFEGKSLIQRHQMIYDAIKDLKKDIHALTIKAYTPKEYTSC